MKHVPIFAFILFLLPLSFAGSAETPQSLTGLLKRVAERNPEARAAAEKWAVTQREARAAGIWPDPMISIIDEKDPSGEEGVEPMKRRHYNVTQSVPFPGKLSSEARMKHHEALIADSNLKNTLLDVVRQAKIAYYKLGSADRLIALMKQNTESMRGALRSTQSRVSANQGSAADVFLAQMELRRVENLLYEKQQTRRTIEIELNALTDDPLDTAWPLAPLPALGDLPDKLERIQALAEDNSPHFQEARHEVNHSRAMLTLTRLGYAPDFGLFYEYQTAGDGVRGTGPSGRQLGLSLSVPLWLKRPLNLAAAAKAHMHEAESTAQTMKNMVRKMIAMEYTEVETHLTLARRIEGEMLPSAQAALNTAREQYAAGRGDFLHLLEANRAWIDAQIDHEDQVYHTLEHWSELEKWTGMDFTPVAREIKNEK